jgi:nucleoside-diphosphate-sugar epimerase
MLLDRGFGVRLLIRKAQKGLLPSAEFVYGDLSDPESLKRAVKGVQGVIHCAAKCGVWGSLSGYIETNTMGTANLIKAASREGLGYFIYTSTYSVVHSSSTLEGVTEVKPYSVDPMAPYAYSKMLAERLVLMANSKGFRTVALRPHLIWGPGDPHLLPRLAARARAKRLFLFSGGPTLIDTIYIDNAAQAHLDALDKLTHGSEVDGQAFFIGQGQPMDLNTLVASLLKAVNAPPIRAKLPVGLGKLLARVNEWLWNTFDLKGEPPLTSFTVTHLSTSHWPDITKARKLLGYEPKVSIGEGLVKLAEAARSGYLQP